MTKIEIKTGMKTVVYRTESTSETCPDSYRVQFQSFRYTEESELAEIRKMQSQLRDDITYTEFILDDYTLNGIINSRNWITDSGDFFKRSIQ